MKDEKFMRMAIEKAKRGAGRGQSPFGACIVKGDKIIACVGNRVWENSDITAHAEISAIRDACRKLKTVDLSGCVIYSTCEPCPMCLSAIHWANISKIICGSRIRDAKKLGFDEMPIANEKMIKLGKCRIKIERDFLRKEALALFEFWRKLGKGKVY